MSKKDIHREPNGNSDISAEEMQRYLKGELSPERMHFLEKKILEEELYEEAMEGLESVGNFNEFNENVADLRSQLDKRVGKKQEHKSVIFNYKSYGIAATLLLLIVSSYFLINNLGETQQADKMVTEAREMAKKAEDKNSLSKKPLDSKEEELKENLEKSIANEVESNTSAAPPSNQPEIKKEAKPTLAIPESPSPSIANLEESVPEADFEEVQEEELALEIQTEPAEEILNLESVADVGAGNTMNDSFIVTQPTVAFSRSAKKSKTQDLETGRILKGKVLSQENNEPLAGVSITLKGTSVGTLTDINGNFYLPVKSREENTTVQISFIGFNTQEVFVGENDEVDFYLGADLSQLEDVVVANYKGSKIDIANSGALPDEKKDNPALRREINSVKEARPEMGSIKYKKYLVENLQYPDEAKSKNIEGVVKLKLSLDDKGNVADIVVENGVGYGCDEEAIRLVKEGPKWEPKRINGIAWESEKIVKVKFKR